MKQFDNSKSLTVLGHGKWKSALMHTLLIIGMVLMSTGVYAQESMSIPDGLVMEKKWVPDDYTGHTGHILVEAFVTGHSVSTHVPTDIVLVLDVSGSMSSYLYDARPSQGYSYSSYGSNTYYYYDEANDEYYAVSRGRSGSRYYLYFTVSSGWWDETTYYLSGTSVTTQRPNYGQNETCFTGVLYERTDQTRLQALKTSVGEFVDIVYRDANQYNVDHRISIVKYASNSYYTSEASLAEGNHRGANDNSNYNYTEVLINRRNPTVTPEGSTVRNDTYIKNQVNAINAGGATASDYGMSKARYLLASIPEDELEERSKVVVLFTDGAPTHSNTFNTDVANTTISNAHDLKHSWTNGSTTYNFDATVFSVGVFSTETAQIRTYMNYSSSNYPDAESMTESGEGSPDNGYYFKAESAGGLTEIFQAIAGASGAMELPAGTIVQDVVSPSFHLPAGATARKVTAYAPLCTAYDDETGVYSFENPDDRDTLIMGSIVVDGQTITGVVTGGGENRLPDGFITVNDSLIQMQGFNFSENWCGYIEDESGTPTIHGRKIVIKIPVEINEGLWGDALQTNDPDHSYIYNPATDEYYGPFNNLTADVQGDVWTEIVTTKPSTFDATQDPIELGSPEDLAWFISYVNGRLDYEEPFNTEVPHWNANAILTADIDMSAHNWVPIGSGSGHNVGGYTGTFDGNGHVITGLKNNASKYFMMETTSHPDGVAVVFPGMFSKVGSGGVVKNVFVLDTDFRGKHHSSDFVHHGIIADTLCAEATIFNCEAAGRLTCNNDNPAQDKNLIYGGLVGLNQGTIHSCMAMVELTGYTMGGMIGENGKNGTNGKFSNGFTNGVYNYLGSDNTYKVGGIAGKNPGSIDNCYVRFERDNTNLAKAGFGMLVGDGTEPTNSYVPQIVTWSRPDYQAINPSTTSEVTTNLTVPLGLVLHPSDNPTNSYTLSVSPSTYYMFTNDNKTGGAWTSGTYNVYEGGKPLVDTLNAKKGNGAAWKRTTAGAYSEGAGNINDDYPVLQFDDFKCLASTDGIRIDYTASLDEMLDRHNNYTVNTNSTWNNNRYKNKEVDAIKGGTINLYVNDSTSKSTSATVGTVVYIDENVSLLQNDNSSIEAYTGQTLKSFVPGGKERWHYVSSSLANSEFGLSYGTSEDVGFSWEIDPCEITMEQEDEDHALFPIDLRSHKRMDFYCFYEPEYHWINFKRNSASHYHMDVDQNGNHQHINNYTNETQFEQGKGYLLSIDMALVAGYNKDAQFVQNRGTLNNGDFSQAVSYTAANEWTGLAGYNLIGNPYQSYFDFDQFVAENSNLWNEGDKFENTYAVYNPQTDQYEQYMSESSEGSKAAGNILNMHQGFLIHTTKTGTARFSNNMRVKDATGVQFRGEKPAFPLINFTVTDKDGNSDLAIIELNRPENDGARKLRVGSPAGRIYFRYDDENLAIYFRNSEKDYQTLFFAAEEDGNFTLNWERANDNFSYLTLVDNITGVKTDMLTHDHYTFEGRTDDYTARFKIMFGETNDEEEDAILDHFAFFNNGELIVNGTGHFEVIDVMGRVLYATDLYDSQNTVILPSNVRGLCMVCFTKGNETKVQKMVIE